MKVINAGVVPAPADWESRVICLVRKRNKTDQKGCGASLQITRDDLVLMKWYGTHFPHYYAAAKCPNCGKHLHVKNLPEPIWDALNSAENQGEAVFDGFDDRV